MAKKRKPQLKQFKRVAKTQYVQARSKNGYVAKTNSKTKYILEVRDRDTKKVLGYINKLDENKKPIPRIFKNRKNFLQSKKRVKAREVRGVYKIVLNNKHFMIDQIEKKGEQALTDILKFIKEKKEIDIKCELHLPDKSVLITGEKRFGPLTNRKELAEWIALRGVVNQVRNIGMRMSPKKYARSKEQTKNKDNTITTATLYIKVLNI